MNPGSAPDPWNLRMRVVRTCRYLETFVGANDIARVIQSRLSGVIDPALPRFERFEKPADIFVDVALHAPEGHRHLQRSVADAAAILLNRLASQGTFEDKDVVGEAIFLAARIEAEQAIGPLAELCGHKNAEESLANGESVRVRALRALFGLLLVFPERRNQYRQTFDRHKFEASCTEVCLPALISLYGVERGALVNEVRAHGGFVDDQRLDLQLLVSRADH
jgi:hypothetical protein